MKSIVKQRFQVKIANAKTGRIKSRTPWQENLVLDTCLTALAAGHGSAGVFPYSCVGSSNTANAIPSGGVTFTQTGTTITASASFFTSGMTGALLKYGTGTSGSEVYLTFVDATHATASVSQTIASPTVGTVYHVERTTLVSWLYTNDNYNSVGNTTGWSIAGSTLTATHQREYIFGQKVSPYTISEIGWGLNNGSNPTINGRAVLNSPQTIGVDDFVILTIQLIVSMTSATPVTTTAGNQLFDQYKGTATTSPKFALETFYTSYVNSDGSTSEGLDAGNTWSICVCTDPSFAQNSVASSAPPSAYQNGYRFFSNVGWQQVSGQPLGVSKMGFSSVVVNTNGEKLVAITARNLGGNQLAAFSIAPNYNDISQASPLPTGALTISGEFRITWARQLSN